MSQSLRDFRSGTVVSNDYETPRTEVASRALSSHGKAGFAGEDAPRGSSSRGKAGSTGDDAPRVPLGAQPGVGRQRSRPGQGSTAFRGRRFAGQVFLEPDAAGRMASSSPCQHRPSLTKTATSSSTCLTLGALPLEMTCGSPLGSCPLVGGKRSTLRSSKGSGAWHPLTPFWVPLCSDLFQQSFVLLGRFGPEGPLQWYVQGGFCWSLCTSRCVLFPGLQASEGQLPEVYKLLVFLGDVFCGLPYSALSLVRQWIHVVRQSMRLLEGFWCGPYSADNCGGSAFVWTWVALCFRGSGARLYETSSTCEVSVGVWIRFYGQVLRLSLRGPGARVFSAMEIPQLLYFNGGRCPCSVLSRLCPWRFHKYSSSFC